MRRMIAILIISSFMLILSGCGAYKDADNEDIFVFSKEEQLYLSVNKKIFSRFDQAGRSIESSWVFPKNAYRFPKKVRVPLATESGLLTKATETIALSDKYEMLAKYNGSVYCDIDCCCSLLLSMNCSNSLSANCSKCCPIMLGQAAGA